MVWGDPQMEAFLKLKEALRTYPVLAYPVLGRRFLLYTDASQEAIGAILNQKGDDGKERPIAFASRVLDKHQKRYFMSEKECLAIVWAVKHFRVYLIGAQTTVYTDHYGLKFILSVKEPKGPLSARLGRWTVALQEYDLTIEFLPGTKMTHVDALTRLPKENIQDLPDDQVEFRYVHTISDDGAILLKEKKQQERSDKRKERKCIKQQETEVMEDGEIATVDSVLSIEQLIQQGNQWEASTNNMTERQKKEIFQKFPQWRQEMLVEASKAKEQLQQMTKNGSVAEEQEEATIEKGQEQEKKENEAVMESTKVLTVAKDWENKLRSRVHATRRAWFFMTPEQVRQQIRKIQDAYSSSKERLEIMEANSKKSSDVSSLSTEDWESEEKSQVRDKTLRNAISAHPEFQEMVAKMNREAYAADHHLKGAVDSLIVQEMLLERAKLIERIRAEVEPELTESSLYSGDTEYLRRKIPKHFSKEQTKEAKWWIQYDKRKQRMERIKAMELDWHTDQQHKEQNMDSNSGQMETKNGDQELDETEKRWKNLQKETVQKYVQQEKGKGTIEPNMEPEKILDQQQMDQECADILVFQSMDAAEIRMEQQDDPELKPLWEYLQDGALPEDQKEARAILYKSAWYGFTEEDLLVKLPKDKKRKKKQDEQDQLLQQLVIPRKLVTMVLEAYHSSFYGGHFGADKLYHTIRRKYFWESMYKDCQKFCQACWNCQKYKRGIMKKIPLHPIPPIAPFARVNIDILYTCLESNAGYKYILVMVDLFSKWPEAVAIKDMSATTVAREFIKMIVCRHGCPRELLSDQGTHFTAQLFREVMNRLGIRKLFNTAYHSQTSGQVERFNGILMQILRCYIDAVGKRWDEFLPFALMAYRSAIQASTKESPFKVVYGREPILPVDLLMMPTETDKMTPQTEYAIEMTQTFQKVWKVVEDNIVKSQEVQKHFYDRKTKESAIEVGDTVLLNVVLVTNRGRKLTPLFDKKYTVKRLSDTNAWIQEQGKPESELQEVHLNRVKKYQGPWGIMCDMKKKVEGDKSDDEASEQEVQVELDDDYSEELGEIGLKSQGSTNGNGPKGPIQDQSETSQCINCKETYKWKDWGIQEEPPEWFCCSPCRRK